MGHMYRKQSEEKKRRKQEAERNRTPTNTPVTRSPAQTDTTAPLPSLDLLRGKAALGDIQTMTGTDYGNYVSYVKGLPAAILQNGLGQAMATLLAGAKLGKEKPPERNADENAKRDLFLQMQAWLCRDDASAPYRNEPNLMQAIVTQEEDAYIRAQAEALAYLRWLKKFATAFLDKPGGDDAPVV